MDTLLPWLHTSNNIVESYIIYLLVITFIGSTDTVTQMCDSCLNNSTCSIITDLNLNVTTVHCLCAHGWLGQHCESRANLLLVSVTMTTATLRWDIVPQTKPSYITDADSSQRNGRNSDNISQEYFHNEFVQLNSIQSLTFSFSIFYWTSNQRQQCNIVPNLTQNVSTISGLTENTEYIFCANVDYTYTCDLNLVNHNDIGPACVYVTTRPKQSVPTVYVILVSCIACVGIFILLLILAVAKRNDFLPMLICAKDVKSRVNNRDRTLPRPKMADSLDEDCPDTFFYKTASTNQKISIYPPNCPGKPNYQLKHKRTRGYASFTARNEQTIPLSTVLEYTTSDHEDDGFVDTDVETDDEENLLTETTLIDNDDDT